MWKKLIAKLRCNRGEVLNDSTDKSGADNSNQSGEKLEGLIQDIDFSDIPEDQRESVKKLVAGKVKLYDTGFRTKSEDIASQRKTLEEKAVKLSELEKLSTEIQGNPEMEKAVTKTINDFRAGKSTPKQTDKSLSKLDQLIESAESAEQREQLKTMREIIKQETPSGIPSEEIQSMKDEIARLKASSNVGLAGIIKSSKEVLKEQFGDELVSKYDVGITEMLTKYPSYIDNPSKVLFNLAEDSEIFEAHEKIKGKKTEVENKRKAAGVFPEGSSHPTEVKPERNKAGRVDVPKHIQKLEEAGRFK